MHSLGVYKEFEKLDSGLPEDSIRVVSLLHDLCKSTHPAYDHIGKGRHGYRSVQLLKALKLKFNIGEYYAIEKHIHRIKDIPSSKTYDRRDMLRHYMHACDHRDSATYPEGFDNYTPDGNKPSWYKLTRCFTAPIALALKSSSTNFIVKIAKGNEIYSTMRQHL